jgi:agmatine deiminase
MPAEWEPHSATWITWPHFEEDFPGKLQAVEWVYVQIVKALASSELVRILVRSEEHQARVALLLSQSLPSKVSQYRTYICPTDRSWLRDNGAIGVRDSRTSQLSWLRYDFNAWARYPNFAYDSQVPAFMSSTTSRSLRTGWYGETQVVLEGGALDVDGEGTILVTEQCLLSSEQERNPGFSKREYEEVFASHLGATKAIWLAGSCSGDDTNGHVDDVARFVGPSTVLLAFEEDPTLENHAFSLENERILQATTDAKGRKVTIVKVPYPEPITFNGNLLPASYANFYIANSVVIVPTFNDSADIIALTTLKQLFPSRKVIGIHAVDLVLGLGTLHCLTQQEPK